MRKRIFKAALLSIVFGLLTAFLFAVPLMEQVYNDEAEQRLETAIALAAGYPVSSGADSYQTLARNAAAKLRQGGQSIRITLIDESGKVLGDSEADPATMENHAARPEVKEALKMGKGRDIRSSVTLGKREMYLAVMKTLTDGKRLVFRAALPLKGFGDTYLLLWACGFIGICFGLIIALVAANYFAGHMVKPLQELTGAARMISAGDMPPHVDDAPDEIGELAAAFNNMSERLAKAHTELKQSSDRLAGILQGMEDGVVALDDQGRVTLLTRRAAEMLGKPPESYERLAECGANYLYIQKILDRVMNEGSPITETVVLAGTPEHILQVYAAGLSESRTGGVLAVVSDVTRLRRLETMRSEFVANVTHEFKTPLTSIKGYIELLKSGPRDEKTAQSFYDIIEIEAERLQKLTEDILQLSEIENARGDEAGNESALVLETVKDAADSLRPEADERRVTITVSVPNDLQVNASPRRLHQLMKNLMENAVKYNREGGRVEVTAGIERGVAVIRVRDTGIGIPPEHLDRIFERFYRVDKGRSREQGGTGLGLSIVKHIVGLYGGDIGVESKPGEGTTFTVRLRCASAHAKQAL